MKKLLQQICDKTKLDKKTVVIIIVGLAGVVMLLMSELVPTREALPEEESQTEIPSTEVYVHETEKRLEEIISSIQGAGKTKVMVTLDCSDENVYATEEKSNDSSYESKVVVVKNQEGENGVLLKVTQPKIRGVAVVCVGGASPSVRQSIIETITAVLGVSSARVSIATMKADNGG